MAWQNDLPDLAYPRHRREGLRRSRDPRRRPPRTGEISHGASWRRGAKRRRSNESSSGDRLPENATNRCFPEEPPRITLENHPNDPLPLHLRACRALPRLPCIARCVFGRRNAVSIAARNAGLGLALNLLVSLLGVLLCWPPPLFHARRAAGRCRTTSRPSSSPR